MNGKSFRQRWRFAASLSVVSISGYFISGWLSPEESHSQDNPAVERFELPSRLLEQERTKVLELQNAGPEQLSEIFRRLAKAEDDDSYNEEGLDSLSLLYPRWAQLEPEGAIRFFQKWSPDGVDDEDEIRHQRNWYLRSFMYQWADIEPLALLKFSRDVADPDLTDVGCHFAMTVIRKRSREKFFALAKALPATIDIRSVYDDAIFELAKEDTEAAMRQLTELPRGSDKILERIRSLSESDELDQDFAANMKLALPKPGEIPGGRQSFGASGQERLSFFKKESRMSGAPGSRRIWTEQPPPT